MPKINIQTTKAAMPRCYCYSTPTVLNNNGWVKIGYTEQDDIEDRIRQQLQTAHIPHHTEWSDVAVLPTAGRISVTAISTPISKSWALSA